MATGINPEQPIASDQRMAPLPSAPGGRLPPMLDQRQGAFFENSTINGVVVGINHGTIVIASGPDGAKLSHGAPITIKPIARVVVRPKPARDFYDRQNCIAELRPELQPRTGTWLHGDPGVGISALLRQIANLPEAETFENGILHIDGNFEPADHEEILRRLYLAYHECSVPIAIAPQEAKRFLGEQQTLFLLDRLPLGYDQLVNLADTFGAGSVIISAEADGPEHLLDMRISGLPRADAMCLCVAATKLDLTQIENAQQIDLICAALGDLPLALVLVNRILRAEAIPVANIATMLQTVTQAAPLQRGVHQPITQQAIPVGAERQALAHATQLALSIVGVPEQTLLGLLVRVGQLDLAALSTISTLQAAIVEPALRLLIDLGLIRAGNERYHVASASLRRVLDQLLPPGDQRRGAAAYFAMAAPAHATDLPWLVREQHNLLSAIQTLLADGQAAQAGALARIAQPGMVLSGNWSTWQQLIDMANQAASTTGDKSLQAWVLHERGTHAGLTGDLPSAGTNLHEAMRLRKQFGNDAGTKISYHNLDYFGLIPPVWWKGLTTPSIIVVALVIIGMLWWNRPLPLGSIPTPIPSVVAPTIIPSALVPSAIPSQPTITVAPATQTVRQPPVLRNDSLIISGAQPGTIRPLENDESPYGSLNIASLRISSEPAHGTQNFDYQKQELWYAPEHGFFGTDTLTYKICDTDDSSVCAEAKIVITVNRSPISVQPDSTATSGATSVPIDVLANDTNPDGKWNSASIVLSDVSPYGTITNDPATGVLTFTPRQGFLGDAIFSYSVCDLNNPEVCGQAAITVMVNPRTPIAVDDQKSMLASESLVISILDNDQDPDGILNPAVIHIVSQSNPQATIELIDAGIRYTLNVSGVGTGASTFAQTPGSRVEQFVYQACSTTYPGLCSNQATVTITISPNLLIANPDQFQVQIGIHTENDPDGSKIVEEPYTSIDILANDSDTDGVLLPIRIDIISQAKTGTVRLNKSNGQVEYLGRMIGTDRFMYRICDPQNLNRCSAPTIVTIEVKPHPLLVQDDQISLATSGLIPVLENDTSPDSELDFSSLMIINQPILGSARENRKTGMIVYTFPKGAWKVDTFTYKICNFSKPRECAIATVTVYPIVVD